MSEAAAAVGFSRLLSDERLTKRAVSGDERAFAAIFRRYHQSLYRFCLAIVGNPEDAQDALQNTMMKVLRALPGEDREIELKPWLYRIAHNESIDLLRRRRETRTLDAEQPAPGYGLAEDAATRDRLRRLITDLRNLPERQRDVLVMRELAGLDFDEIATALSTSGAVARQTLYEARQSLRQMEEGREMNCETVMKALSDGDGRVTRRRDVRAHLRSCVACSGFRDEIKGRQQEFAALSPLPAIAAAGMLQGLIGGSSAATGGGLAALFGGGAAQGIGASAAAKGVATVAVAAAVGVTAADRTGVIHVGLPGGGEAKTSEPVPGSHSHQRDHDDGGSQAGLGKAGVAGGKAGEKGSAQPGVKGQASSKSAPGSAGAAEGTAADRSSRADVDAGSKGYGPGVDHPSGREHEKQHPPAASVGQETAAGNKPPPPETPAAAGGEPPVPAKPPKPTPEVPAKPSKPSKPTPEPGSVPKNAPTSAPAPSAPSPPQQANPPSPPSQSRAPAAPGPPSAPEEGKGASKGKGKGPS
jgi:RNA polymerase sigma factor (sigma-70 family)